jgi:hypothetical protein
MTCPYVYCPDPENCLVGEQHGPTEIRIREGEARYNILRIALAEAQHKIVEMTTALQAALDYIPCSEVHNWPPGWELKKKALTLIKQALKGEKP